MSTTGRERRKRVGFLTGVVGLIAGGIVFVAFLVVARNGADSVQGSRVAPEQGVPWNGGKMRLPVSLESDLEGPVPVNADQPVTLRFRVDRPCEELSVRVRGLGGVIVVSGGKWTLLGACQPGEATEHEVVVRVPSGVAGSLVADLRLDGLAGPGGAQSQSTSLALAIEAEGAKRLAKPQGKVERDAEGRPSIVELGNGKNVP